MIALVQELGKFLCIPLTEVDECSRVTDKPPHLALINVVLSGNILLPCYIFFFLFMRTGEGGSIMRTFQRIEQIEF